MSRAEESTPQSELFSGYCSKHTSTQAPRIGAATASMFGAAAEKSCSHGSVTWEEGADLSSYFPSEPLLGGSPLLLPGSEHQRLKGQQANLVHSAGISTYPEFLAWSSTSSDKIQNYSLCLSWPTQNALQQTLFFWESANWLSIHDSLPSCHVPTFSNLAHPFFLRKKHHLLL